VVGYIACLRPWFPVPAPQKLKKKINGSIARLGMGGQVWIGMGLLSHLKYIKGTCCEDPAVKQDLSIEGGKTLISQSRS
jgi:hypothetical protein